MVNHETVRIKAAQLAHRHRGLSASELRGWLDSYEGRRSDDETWLAFRSAYFDALWAGAQEMAARPVVATSGFPQCKPLTACAHLTLAFVAGRSFELIDATLEHDFVGRE
jgi:hypothetical protein